MNEEQKNKNIDTHNTVRQAIMDNPNYALRLMRDIVMIFLAGAFFGWAVWG